MKMKAIFKDPELQDRFQRDGFVVMPFISENELQVIRKFLYEKIPVSSLERFYSTTFSSDLKWKQEISALGESVLGDQLESVFRDVRRLGASFLIKPPGEQGDLPLHQDWTMCDEMAGEFTATIWIPLVNVDQTNGAIRVLPGSHRFTNILRAPSLPPVWGEVEKELLSRMETLNMKAGEAFIFTHGLLHGSHINNSNEPRPTLTFGLTPENVQLFYHWREADHVLRMAVQDDFYQKYYDSNRCPEEAIACGKISQELSPVTQEELDRMYAGKTIVRPIKSVARPKAAVNYPSMHNVLRQAKMNEELARNGFVIFDLLDTTAVTQLKATFSEYRNGAVDRFYSSSHEPSPERRVLLHQKITDTLRPYLEVVLDEADVLGSAFIAKPSGNAGVLPPHADWNIVDESVARSFNLWIPLVKTTDKNGAIQLLPGSHTWFDFIRGPGIVNPYGEIIPEVWAQLKTFCMEPGQALLYDHRLLHASGVNDTGELRLATVTGIVPKGAELLHYRRDDWAVRSYHADVDFYLTENPEQSAGNLKLRAIESYAQPQVSLTEFQYLTGIEKNEAISKKPDDRSFWQTYTPGNILREIRSRAQSLFS